MSPAIAALAIIVTPPVVGIIWHGVLSPSTRDKVRSAVCAAERSVERLGESSERFKDSFARPTL